MALLEPLVAVKNYKSQVPFPQDLSATIRCMARIRRKAVQLTNKDPTGVHRTDLAELLRLEGFGLPTASAVLHFSHPEHFPIIDQYVQAACEVLMHRHPDDFARMTVPRLPYPYEAADEAKAVALYETFIHFIRRVCELQSAYTKSNLRYVDQGLMVLGKLSAREHVEANLIAV